MIKLPIIDLEFKALIPPLLPEEWEQLEQNIVLSRKCYDPIILWEGIIIDGHNRFEICMKHGVEFRIEELELPDREAARIWMLENQLGRRNLSDVARMDMALLKEELLREKARKNLSDGGRKGGSKPLPLSSKPKLETTHIQETIAAEAGVSKGKLCQYTQVKGYGCPVLVGKVQSGELKVGTAHRLLPTEINKQLTQVSKSLTFFEKAIPEGTSKTENPDLYIKIVNLTSALQELSDKLSEGGDHAAA